MDWDSLTVALMKFRARSSFFVGDGPVCIVRCAAMSLADLYPLDASSSLPLDVTIKTSPDIAKYPQGGGGRGRVTGVG